MATTYSVAFRKTTPCDPVPVSAGLQHSRRFLIELIGSRPEAGALPVAGTTHGRDVLGLLRHLTENSRHAEATLCGTAAELPGSEAGGRAAEPSDADTAMHATNLPGSDTAIHAAELPGSGAAMRATELRGSGAAMRATDLPGSGAAMRATDLPGSGAARHAAELPGSDTAGRATELPGSDAAIHAAELRGSGAAIRATDLPGSGAAGRAAELPGSDTAMRAADLRAAGLNLADLSLADLLREWERSGAVVESALRGSRAPAGSVLLTDLFVHELDIRRALGAREPDHHPAIPTALDVVVGGAGAMVSRLGLPAMRFETSGASWVVGEGEPTATVSAPPVELFNSLTGRRSLRQIRALRWSADPGPRLRVFAWGPFRPLPDPA